ncbi:LmbU family transcriptional regulator [Nonomuraea sp. NPDC003709]|uniref:LmbU family transcriptional regulator n=1 Tax=Nonomuraea sp. NPDC003709 TaxID=3154450 RepID=UPI0033AF7975
MTDESQTLTSRRRHEAVRVAQPGSGEQPRLGLDRTVIPRRTGLQFPVPIALDCWERIGRQLSLISDSSSWWLGDWLVYGESQYSDRYRTAIQRTSLDYQTLRNYAWVSRRFSLPRRRDKLSFAHHAEVAAMSEAEQDLWLDRAEKLRWSRNRLRRELRGASTPEHQEEHEQEATEARPVGPMRGDASGLALSPSQEQLERWQLAARLEDCELSNWVMQVAESFALEIIKRHHDDGREKLSIRSS